MRTSHAIFYLLICLTCLAYQGCGRGYDVLLFALHGIDAYGLEISSTAVEQARSYTSSKIQELATAPDGNVQFFNGDFYKEDWLQECRLGSNKEFDFVYDYTVCPISAAFAMLMPQ